MKRKELENMSKKELVDYAVKQECLLNKYHKLLKKSWIGKK